MERTYRSVGVPLDVWHVLKQRSIRTGLPMWRVLAILIERGIGMSDAKEAKIEEENKC
jgi:hypothetical protein